MADFEESKHPRAENGQFGSGSGKKARLTPTEKTYISSYTGDEFYKVNADLRQGGKAGPIVKHLDSAIAKQTLEKGTALYRGLTREAFKSLLGEDEIRVGQVFSDPAYSSTGKNREFVSRFYATGGVVLHIETGHGQNGLDVEGLTRNPAEGEVLLPRKTRYEVLGIGAPKNIGDPVRVRVRTLSQAGDSVSKADAAMPSDTYIMAAPLSAARAAGLVCVSLGRVLLLLRSNQGDAAGMWALPGGKLEDGEDAQTALRRELQEELSHIPPGAYRPLTATDDGAVAYETFVVNCPPFAPTLNDEHDGYVWAPLGGPYPDPLHPGVAASLAALTTDELDAAEGVRSGALPSPYKFNDQLWLVAMRVTGTGYAYRGGLTAAEHTALKARDPATLTVNERADLEKGLEEFVYRPPEEYLNERFLRRCAGLPIIVEHPEDVAALDTEEFKDRVVGSAFVPYVRGDEVWVVARVYDERVVDILRAETWSTSPNAVFHPSTNSQLTLADGTALLAEGKPRLLDHLAIVANGVWDKGRTPSGIEVTNPLDGETAMLTADEYAALKAKEDLTDAEKARMKEYEDSKADKKDAKKDAEDKKDEPPAWAKSIMDSLGSLKTRMDSFDKKDAKKDAANDDAGTMPGAATVTPEKVAAGGEGTPKMPANQPKMDASAEELKERLNKADSASTALQARLDALEGRLPTEVADNEREAQADAQAKADAVYQAFGERAPAPLRGEQTLNYRRRLVKPHQAHSAVWKDVDLATLPETALRVAEHQIRADAMVASRSPIVPGGGLREVIRKGVGNREITEFYGSPAAWLNDFKMPVQRVAYFNTPNRGQ